MTSAIETALTELSANLRRMEQRHQAVGYKFDRLYDLIAAAREELATASGLPAQADARNAAMAQAIDAMELALSSHGVALLSSPPQDAWMSRGVSGKLRDAIAAISAAKAAK